MDVVRSLPSTMVGLSAWCLGIGALILLIFRGSLKPAVVFAIFGGIGLAGGFGNFVDRVVSGGSRASSNVTLSLFGSAVPTLFLILVAFLLYKYAFRGGDGGGSLVGSGRGRGRGKGGGLALAGGGGGRGGKVWTLAKNWTLFVCAAAIGAAIGTIPHVYNTLNTGVGWLHSGAMTVVS